ncbi:MAG: hypothetical protein SNJ82_12130 [Gemmataceae bacterium]
MSDSLSTTWPPGSQIQAVRFVATATASEPGLVELAAPIAQRAIAVAEGQQADALLLTIPVAADPALESDPQLLAWIAPDGRDSPQRQLIVLQGAQLHWHLPRIALLASPQRLELVRPAVLEMLFLENELRSIESELARLWPDLEADAALAFSFEERSLTQRDSLRHRFLRVVCLRSRLAKITPRLVIPQVYPPTLASQMQERLRERLHVSNRLEALETQLELFERIYDQGGQRASDYLLSRRSYILEWFIVILLLLQIVLQAIELLSAGNPN